MASLLEFLSAGKGSGLLGSLHGQEPQPSSSEQGSGIGNGLGNFLSNNPLMLMALGGGIAQGGIGRGLQLAVPAAETERKERKQEQVQGITYNALRTAGVPHGQALAGALNPEILKTIARAHFDAKPSFEAIGHDESGQPTYGFVDPLHQLITPYKQPSGAPVPALETRDPQNGGAASKQVTSVNRVIGHLENLMEASKNLDEPASASSNASVAPSSSTGSPRRNTAARQFEFRRDALAGEMTKLLRSNGASEKEIVSWREKLLGSNTPAELKAMLGGSVDLIDSRLAALKDQHERETGRTAPEWIAPRSRTALEKLRQWAKEESPE